MSPQNVKVTRDEKRWEVEISAEIPVAALTTARAHALKDIGKSAELSGFRKGHVPEAILVKHFGEDAILREAAEHALKDALPEIIAKEQLNIVEAPRVSIEPPKPGLPLKFTARAPLAPEVKEFDYADIAKKANAKKKEVELTDTEHTEALTHLRRERARVEHLEAGIKPEEAAEKAQKADAKDLPALDDEFVKGLGFESAAIFSDKVREQLKEQKSQQAKSVHRAELLDALLKKATINIPTILTEYELDDMEAQFTHDLGRAGQTLGTYLADAKKTREKMREEWTAAAEKRAKIRVLLSEIARKEKIEPDAEKVSHEFTHAKKHYKDASEASLRAHIAHMMRNESVLEWLEARGL